MQTTISRKKKLSKQGRQRPRRRSWRELRRSKKWAGGTVLRRMCIRRLSCEPPLRVVLGMIKIVEKVLFIINKFKTELNTR